MAKLKLHTRLTNIPVIINPIEFGSINIYIELDTKLKENQILTLSTEKLGVRNESKILLKDWFHVCTDGSLSDIPGGSTGVTYILL